MPYLRSGLLADLLDLLELRIGGLLCVLLGLLVAAGVLFAVSYCPCPKSRIPLQSFSTEGQKPAQQDTCSAVRLTSVSKDLNSDSFCDL